MSPFEKHGFSGKEIEKLIHRIRADHNEYFELASDTNTLCQKAMLSLDAHGHNGQEVISVSLYMRSLNNFQAVLILAERGMVPQARIMARAMLESIFMLCAICKKEELVKVFVDEDKKKRLKNLDKFKKFYGGTFPPDFDPGDIEKLKIELKADVLKDKIQIRTTEKWAEDADMTAWYLTVYALLSDSVHTKVSDLERHVETDKTGEINEFKWGPDTEGIEDVLAAATEAMINAFENITTLFKSKNDDIADLRKRFALLSL